MQSTKVAIIGSGPAGYTAALYSARARLEPVQFTGFKSGGQLMWTTDIENFPGFPNGIPGPQLMMDMREQAEHFGTVMRDEYVTAVDFSQRPFRLWSKFPEGFVDDFEQVTPEKQAEMRQEIMKLEPDVEAESVIIATGAASIMLGIPGEMDFLGRGVSTCAVCDAAFYRDKKVYVVGGGDSAMEDTLALTKFAREVHIVHRRSEFRASKIMQERVLNNEKVSVIWNAQVEEVLGDQQLRQLRISEEGTQKTVDADGLFIAIGHRPMTGVFAGQVELDDHGYVVTRHSFSQKGAVMAERAHDGKGLLLFPSMTSVDGVFAGGDNVDVRYKQAITAAGQGCMAALDAERWLERQEG